MEVLAVLGLTAGLLWYETRKRQQQENGDNGEDPFKPVEPPSTGPPTVAPPNPPISVFPPISTSPPVTTSPPVATNPPLGAIGQPCGTGKTCPSGTWCNSDDNRCYENCYAKGTCTNGNAIPRKNTYFCDYSGCGATSTSPPVTTPPVKTDPPQDPAKIPWMGYGPQQTGGGTTSKSAFRKNGFN